MIANWTSRLRFLLMLTVNISVAGFTSPVSADIYQCQVGQGKAEFTDNPFSCPQAKAKVLTLRTQVLQVERKVLASIPDLSQRDPAAGFPNDGRMFCAPVAVSNSLSSALGGMPSSRQIELAHTLGSAEYMATDHKGTSPRQLLQGVDRFLQSADEVKVQNLTKGQLEYRGQVSVERKYNPSLDKQVDLSWLINGVKQEKHIWLNLGWYKTQADGRQKRVGGHWVTLVGYEKLGSLKDGKGEFLIISDPATRHGDAQEQVAIRLSKLNGRLGYELINQASKPSKANTAWLEGAIQLAL